MTTNKEEYETKSRKYILNFLKVNNFISEDDNLINAQKAFITRSVLKHVLDLRKAQEADDESLNLCFRMLNAYKNDKVGLFWKDGKVAIQILHKVKEENDNAESIINEVEELFTKENSEKDDPEPPKAA